MFKVILSLAIITSSIVSAAEQSVSEYTGKISNIYVGKAETIKVGVVREEENEFNCGLNDEYAWPLKFQQGQLYSKEWFDILNLVRRTQETIRIGYTFPTNADSPCDIEYLALLKGDGNDPDAAAGDALSRHGRYGNIALIFTNNLDESNYSASDHTGGDIAAAAFDGHLWDEQIDEDLGSLINRGIWVVEKDSEINDDGHWLQIEFENVINVTGFRIMVNEKSVEAGRSPRSITILSSIDGEKFVEYGGYNLSKSIVTSAILQSSLELKYFRVRVDSNYGNAFIEIDELEIYSD
jgi:hypothetical protein